MRTEPYSCGTCKDIWMSHTRCFCYKLCLQNHDCCYDYCLYCLESDVLPSSNNTGFSKLYASAVIDIIKEATEKLPEKGKRECYEVPQGMVARIT